MARKVERGYEKVRKRMGKKKKRGGKWKGERRQERENNEPTIPEKKKKNNPLGQPKNGTKGRKSTEGAELCQINNDGHINNDMVIITRTKSF